VDIISFEYILLLFYSNKISCAALNSCSLLYVYKLIFISLSISYLLVLYLKSDIFAKWWGWYF